MRNKSFYYPLMIAMLLLLCTPFVTVVYAQSFTVTGTVADSQGGVPGVNVKVKGSTTGTITDMDGKFTLNVPSSKSVLVISYIGYTTQEIPVNNQKILNINLKEDTKVLDEVVVVGYGVQKKSHLTGSVSKMDVNNLTDIPVTQVDQLLQGKIAGVNIRTPPYVYPAQAPGSGTSRYRSHLRQVTVRNNCSGYSSGRSIRLLPASYHARHCFP